jgi:hypothetical protein
MDLYSRKQRWKLVLAVVAMLIVGASLWYSNRIVDRVRFEERRKVQPLGGSGAEPRRAGELHREALRSAAR